MAVIETGDVLQVGVYVFCIAALLVFNAWRDRVDRRTR